MNNIEHDGYAERLKNGNFDSSGADGMDMLIQQADGDSKDWIEAYPV